MKHLFLLLLIISFRNDANFEDEVEGFLKECDNDFRIKACHNDFTYYLEHNSSPDWQKKVSLMKGANRDNYPEIDLYFYEYETPKEVQRIQEKLLDCFPNECLKVHEGENLDAIKIQPSVHIFNDTSIIVAQVQCKRKESDWNDVKNMLVSSFSNANSDVVTTGCGGPLKWK